MGTQLAILSEYKHSKLFLHAFYIFFLFSISKTHIFLRRSALFLMLLLLVVFFLSVVIGSLNFYVLIAGITYIDLTNKLFFSSRSYIQAQHSNQLWQQFLNEKVKENEKKRTKKELSIYISVIAMQ